MKREIFGFNTLHRLGKLVDEFDSKKVFLVTGKKSFTLSGAKKKIYDILKDVSFTRFSSLSKNPNIEDIKQGINSFEKNNPDLVVGVGGGSIIDMAKAVNILAVQENKPELYIKGKKKLLPPKSPLIAIPTTAGTGSESTHFATIYIDKKKFSLSSSLMLPAISIVDPSLTESMPRYLTASTGMDALCQGIESYWSINSTEESRKYAMEAMNIALKNIEKAVNKPDKESRIGMAKASHLSGKAINISKTTACHSVSYPITSYFGIPHGHAVALTMPQMIEFNSQISKNDCNDKRGEDFVKKRIDEIIKLCDAKNAVDVKKKFQTLMDEIGIERRLSKLDIDYEGSRLIIEKGFTPDRMNNNPRVVSKWDIEKIINQIL